MNLMNKYSRLVKLARVDTEKPKYVYVCFTDVHIPRLFGET